MGWKSEGLNDELKFSRQVAGKNLRPDMLLLSKSKNKLCYIELKVNSEDSRDL